MPDTRVMELPDGRELAWMEAGKARGRPVFAFHGTPGSRRQVAFDEKAIAAAGVRMIAVDRPGYGHSSFHPGRTLSDWPSDVAALADHLKIGTCAVVGVSGGGPHALACARFLPDLVSATAVVSGVGPLGEPECARGMEGVNRGTTLMARRMPPVLHGVFLAQEFVARRWPETALRAATRMFPPADVALLERPDVRAAFLEDEHSASVGARARAGTQDFVLFAGDWGFRFEDIAGPVHFWHGDADRNVPMDHARFMSGRVPGAVLHECPGEGHLLYVEHLEEVLRTVAPPT
jgi:pimeloyl-ACP methyl ester carboxylesterase